MTRSNLTTLIDDLGLIKAQVAELELQADAIKDQLKEMGEGAYEGELFRASVSRSDRQTLDMVAVRAKLTPQFIAAHTRTTPVWTVRVNARTH